MSCSLNLRAISYKNEDKDIFNDISLNLGHEEKIAIIGSNGSGKSTLGVVLAKKIGYSFIDSDIVIQDTYKKTLEQLIEENGDTGFIKIENDVNCLISPEHTIIATGGSAVYGDERILTLCQQSRFSGRGACVID